MVKQKARAKPKQSAKPAKRADPPPTQDADTEQRILDAAHAVFVRRGTAGARMQEIADEAGVNKALLHYYFRSKSRLADAVFRRVATGIFARLHEAAGSDAELEDKVRRIIAIYLDQLAKTPYVPGYVIGELNQHPDRARQFIEVTRPAHDTGEVPAFLTKLGAQMQARVRAGTMRPIPPRQFLANLASLCVFPFAARPLLCAALGLDDRGFKAFIDERKAGLADFFLSGLRP
jgi:TetR/AcrR family transcriptional regulator